MSSAETDLSPKQLAVVRWIYSQSGQNFRYPERFAEFKQQLIERLDDLQVKVPGQSPNATTLFYSGKLGSTDLWKVAEEAVERVDQLVVREGAEAASIRRPTPEPVLVDARRGCPGLANFADVRLET